MSEIKLAESIGEVQRYLEAAAEHMAHVWGHLRKAGLLPEPLEEYGEGMPDYAKRWPMGDFVYPLAAVHKYMEACRQGMIEFVGDTEGQLCPYEECAHDLAIESAGWCKCGHCGRPFYARDWDGDYEDYVCRKPKAGEVVPQALLYCRDLGTSWATPESA